MVSGGICVSWPAGPEPAPPWPESANGPWPMVWIIGGIFISDDAEIIFVLLHIKTQTEFEDQV